MKAINVFLALLISVVFGVLVLEGGLRLLGHGPKQTMNEFDAVLGWSKTPDSVFHTKTPEFDVTYEINHLGLRDDPMSNPTKPLNTFRVVMLGDSFTLGLAVNREDLFVDQLERWWRSENRRVDVINTGTEGYSTDQQVRWLMEYGPEFQPDLVLLFAYENDLYWNAQTQYMGAKDKPRFTPEGQLERRTLADHSDKSWKSRFALTQKLIARPDSSRHFFHPEGGAHPILKEFGPVLLDAPAFMTEVIDSTRGALKALKSEADKLGARVVVVPIPSHAVVDSEYREQFGKRRLGLPSDRWDPRKPVDTLLALAKEVGLETLDPRTTFKATAAGQELYNSIDWHLNPAGNAALARYLHDELDNLSAFPEGHTAPAGTSVDLPVAVRGKTGAPFWLRLYAGLWAALTTLYLFTYKDEPKWQPPLKVGVMLSAVFAIVIGGKLLIGMLPPQISQYVAIGFVLGVLSFIMYKIGRRLATIVELLKSFILRGHWYLMPLIVVLLTIGSLLVVAASSPLIAPFIYTLF